MRPLVAVLATAVMVVAGCSDDADPEPTPPTPAPTTSSAPPPTTVAEACARLIGDDGLVQQALDLADGSAAEREPVETALFDLLTNDLPPLDAPVRQLVDFVTDPEPYLVDGRPDVFVTDAVSAIETACA